jgi:hypothetical protein
VRQRQHVGAALQWPRRVIDVDECSFQRRGVLGQKLSEMSPPACHTTVATRQAEKQSISPFV